ncbi:MAG: hypothetical protein KIT60_15905 [Burkholderiaceae bacterium]|nr:hypothetical protein [Burkholderiaceae bacterium]
MHSQQLSELRARAEYPPRWLLVPMVPVIVVLAAWLLTALPRGADVTTPVVVDSIDTAAGQQLGA